jgi:hypothetical protein
MRREEERDEKLRKVAASDVVAHYFFSLFNRIIIQSNVFVRNGWSKLLQDQSMHWCLLNKNLHDDTYSKKV